MKSFVFGGISFFLLLSITVRASNENCRSPSFKKYLAMDYKTFDQSPPDGGWRNLKDKGRDIEIANLIDTYLGCRKGLTPEQKATMVFHTGQIYADIGNYREAIERMKRSYDDGLDGKYHWNSFVDATIAFLENDKENGPTKIRTAQANIAAKEKDHPYIEVLDNLVNCYGKPYKDIGVCVDGLHARDKSKPQEPKGAR